MDIAWMAWTWQTSLLFVFLALALAVDDPAGGAPA